MIFNNLSDHVYLLLVVLLIFKIGRNNLTGHVYVFHVVMTCYTSTCQHKKTRPCKHYRNIRGVHRRFRIMFIFIFWLVLNLLIACEDYYVCSFCDIIIHHI